MGLLLKIRNFLLFFKKPFINKSFLKNYRLIARKIVQLYKIKFKYFINLNFLKKRALVLFLIILIINKIK